MDPDILEGVTRDSILTLARDLGIPTIERPVDKSELLIADEIFLCGTAAQIVHVLGVENYQLPEERPVTPQLRTPLKAIAEGKYSFCQDWLAPVALN